jgi:hypothetical protein
VDITKLQTDSSLEESGVWRPCGDGKILVASSSSDRYKQVAKRIIAPYESSFALNVIGEEKAKELENRTISEGILLGWENMQENGVDVPYSPEKAFEWISKVPRFKQLVTRESENIENFRRAQAEAEVKNSAPVSTGS